MEHFEWYDGLRVLTAILGVIAMYFLGYRMRNRRRAFSSVEIDLWWGLNAALVVAIVGSIENIIQNNEFGWRVMLTFLATAIILRGAFALYRSETPFPRK